MFKRITGIAFILVCTSTAWMILAANIWSRTNESSDKITPNMASIWGTPQVQTQPEASYEVVSAPGQKTQFLLPAESSRVNVNLALEHRQKGLLWYSVYTVNFDGLYRFQNTSADPQDVKFQLSFPSSQAIYDGLSLRLNGQPHSFETGKDGAHLGTRLAPGEVASFRVTYRSQGLESWRYKLGDDISQTRDFALNLKTSFEQIDFPLNTLAPTEKHRAGEGWDMAWRYTNLISGFQIGMTMPEKPQPGPLAGQICLFAPISLLLYFFVMFILTTIRKIDLHPMNYFFLAASFFAFHLLLAYLVDRIAIQVAFLICSLVSVALAVSYLRIVVGSRFALVEAGLAQMVYLVLFSYTFFLKGFTGLSVTIGCILTLFIAMQVTAPIRWTELFATLTMRPEQSKA